MLTPHLTETYSQNYIDMEDITIQRLQEGTPLSYTDREAILKMYNEVHNKSEAICPSCHMGKSFNMCSNGFHLSVEQSQQAPVKTLAECKDEVAKKHGHRDWEDLDRTYTKHGKIYLELDAYKILCDQIQPAPSPWIRVTER